MHVTVTSYWRSKLSKVGQSWLQRGSLWWLLPTLPPRVSASGELMLEPSWLTSLSLALNKRDRNKCHWGLQAFEVAKLTGCTPAGKRKPIKSTQRQNVLCERWVFFGDGPQWGRQLWLFQGHGAITRFLKDFCDKFWLKCFHVGLNI